MSLNRGQLETSPEFDPATAVNQEFEVRLYDYYGRPIDDDRPMPPGLGG